jgi:hypothetical protein
MTKGLSPQARRFPDKKPRGGNGTQHISDAIKTNPGIVAGKAIGLSTTDKEVPPWLVNDLTGEIDIPHTPLSEVEYQKSVWEKRAANGELAPGSAWAKKIDRSKDLEEIRNLPKLAGKPEMNKEEDDPKVAIPSIVDKGVRFCCGCKRHVDASEMKPMRDPQIPTGFVDRCESCRAANKATTAYRIGAPHVMISDTERKARVAAHKAQGETQSSPSVDDYLLPEIQQFLTDWYTGENAANLKYFFAWRHGKREINPFPANYQFVNHVAANLMHLTTVKALPAPQPSGEPETEEWVEVIEEILPLQLWESMDYIPGYSPKFEYCCDYDVPLPPVRIVRGEKGRFAEMLRQKQALKAA